MMSPLEEARREAFRLLDNDEELDLETRIGLARALVAKHPEEGELWSVLGELRLESGDETEALMAFERAVAKNDALGSSWHWIGIIKKRQRSDLDGAIDAFQNAITHGMSRAVELNEIAVTMTLQKDIEGALSIWIKAIEEDPDWGILYTNAIKASTILGMKEEARGLFLQGLEAERFDERTALGWTDYLVRHGDEDDALRDYSLALEKHPDSIRIRYYYASTLREEGEKPEAIAEFEKIIAMETTDENRATKEASAKALFDLKFPEKAKVLIKAEKYIFKEELSSDKDLRRVRESIENLSEIITDHDGLWEPILMRGTGYRRIGEWDAATSDFNRVLELAPDQPNAVLNLGLIHQDKGEFEAAADFALRAMATAPRDPFIQVNGIFVLINTQHCDEAVQAIKQSSELLTEDLLETLEVALQGACQ